MITLVYINEGKESFTTDLSEIKKIPRSDYLWLDLLNITDEERTILGKNFKVGLQLLKTKKIRHSFRFSENENRLKINTRLLHREKKNLKGKPISFILEDDFLISNHNISHLSYEGVYKEIKMEDVSVLDGKRILLRILGKILEYDIDTIEDITSNIVKLSKRISSDENLDEGMIYNITALQEQLLLVRRNIIDKERVIVSLSKSDRFTKKSLQKQIHILERDLHSILDYISFDFERLEYIQDTLMGLINLKQNVIMKIFTIASVIFLPPTLIASIYGMNFQDMPELKFPYAYPVAITIMALLSLSALLYFKRKKWL
jgi:magnesium transporter